MLFTNSGIVTTIGVNVLPCEDAAPGSAAGVNCSIPSNMLILPTNPVIPSPIS
jgi:hypothetical protein